MIRKINETLFTKTRFRFSTAVRAGRIRRYETNAGICRQFDGFTVPRSRKTRDNAEMDGEIVNNVDVTLVMFTDPRHEVLAGDTVDILHQENNTAIWRGNRIATTIIKKLSFTGEGEA